MSARPIIGRRYRAAGNGGAGVSGDGAAGGISIAPPDLWISAFQVKEFGAYPLDVR